MKKEAGRKLAGRQIRAEEEEEEPEEDEFRELKGALLSFVVNNLKPNKHTEQTVISPGCYSVNKYDINT